MPDAKPVEAADPARITSKIAEPVSAESTVLITNERAKSYWNDAVFENGDRITLDGKCYEANNGQWVPV